MEKPCILEISFLYESYYRGLSVISGKHFIIKIKEKKMKMIKPLLLSVALMTIIAERGVAADLGDLGAGIDPRGFTSTSASVDSVDGSREGDKITLASLFDETPIEANAQITDVIRLPEYILDRLLQDKSVADESKNFISYKK